MPRRQLIVLAIMLFTYALTTFVSLAFFFDKLSMGLPVPRMEVEIPPCILGLANAGIVLVIYGLLGLAGYWFAPGLSGLFREDANLPAGSGSHVVWRGPLWV